MFQIYNTSDDSRILCGCSTPSLKSCATLRKKLNKWKLLPFRLNYYYEMASHLDFPRVCRALHHTVCRTASASFVELCTVKSLNKWIEKINIRNLFLDWNVHHNIHMRHDNVSYFIIWNFKENVVKRDTDEKGKWRGQMY